MNYTPYVAVKFLTELLIAAALYLFPMERRKYFAPRLLLSLALCYALSLFTSPIMLPSFRPGWIWFIPASALRYIVIYFSVVLAAWFCFRLEFHTAVFLCTGAFAVQHLGQALCQLVEPLYIDHVSLPVQALLYLAVMLLGYGLLYPLAIRRSRRSGLLRLKSRDTLRFNLLAIVGLDIIDVLGGFGFLDTPVGRLSYFGYSIICSVFLLYMQADLFERSALERENEQIEYILEQERKQFESFRTGVEYLDIKCHDLKHQIHLLKGRQVVDSAVLDELESSMAAYESYAQTGCPALDVMLGEKFLRCSAAGIPFTCAVSSRKINSLREADIYSLFGNALDNAIEYELTLPEEKRFIRLSVRDFEDMLLIRVENYYEGPPIDAESGLITTKEDARCHGFGIKSMRHIAAKYGGELGISSRDGVFCLTVIFTLPGEK